MMTFNDAIHGWPHDINYTSKRRHFQQEGTIPKDTFRKAQVTTLDEALAAAARIGYPVMVKASEGGGGKGIRMSHSDEDMRSHFVQVAVHNVLNYRFPLRTVLPYVFFLIPLYL